MIVDAAMPVRLDRRSAYRSDLLVWGAEVKQ
jgi:hypothetical protein